MNANFYKINVRILDHEDNQKQPPDMSFYKKAILKNFSIFTENDLGWTLFLIKWQSFKPATLLKKDSNTAVFL